MTNLEFIKALKSFGENQLGLFFGDSFQEVLEEDFSCNWVYATYKNEMKSVFKDNFPFEFYPDEEKALLRQKELQNLGYDTYFYHAEAHGGGNCPITKELLNSTKARKCYVVLHEAWHVLSRRDKHQFSYSFEESSGRVIGLFGGIEFAQFIKDDILLQENINQEKAWAIFADFVNETYAFVSEKLKDENSDLNVIKEYINSEAKKVYLQMPDSWEKEELNKEINNAFLLRYHDYTVFYPKAKEIYQNSKNVKEAMKKYSEITDL